MPKVEGSAAIGRTLAVNFLQNSENSKKPPVSGHFCSSELAQNSLKAGEMLWGFAGARHFCFRERAACETLAAEEIWLQILAM